LIQRKGGRFNLKYSGGSIMDKYDIDGSGKMFRHAGQ